MNETKRPSWLALDKLSNWLTFGVVFIAFILSFGALRDLAADVGIVYPALYPLMIDAGLVIYNIMALQSSLNGERNRYAWALIIFATLASVFLNVVHSLEELPPWLDSILGPAMAAIPPLVIFGAFHLVVLRIEQKARRIQALTTLAELDSRIADRTRELDNLHTQMATEQDKLSAGIDDLSRQQQTLLSAIEALTQQKAALTADMKTIQNQAFKKASGTAVTAAANGAADTISQRREKVRQMVREGLEKKEIADALGVHVRTITRDISALEDTEEEQD